MSKLFDKWELDEVKIEDLGLVKYICLDETLVPHTSGRHCLLYTSDAADEL